LTGVSCICPTYARPQLLEEAIHSFLVQDFEGEKELLVLNDFGPQTLRFDHPEVTLINLPVRFRTLGAKRNAAVSLCRYDVIAVWDDDDICLPHRLSYSMRNYEQKRRFFWANKYFLVNEGKIRSIQRVRSHSLAVWHRSLFEEVGGYPARAVGEDADLQIRFFEASDWDQSFQLEDQDIFYLRRWLGTGSFHTQSISRDDESLTHDRIEAAALQQLSKGTIPAGVVDLEPHWTLDWARLASDFLSSQR
jgi:glycosyltransferase involved in cell wall biosynthesis